MLDFLSYICLGKQIKKTHRQKKYLKNVTSLKLTSDLFFYNHSYISSFSETFGICIAKMILKMYEKILNTVVCALCSNIL